MIKKIVKRSRKSQAQPQSKKQEFSAEALREDILHEAKLLMIPEIVARTITDKVVCKTEKWLEKKAAITSDDLNRYLAEEIKKYNEDLAYVYQNRGKII